MSVGRCLLEISVVVVVLAAVIVIIVRSRSRHPDYQETGGTSLSSLNLEHYNNTFTYFYFFLFRVPRKVFIVYVRRYLALLDVFWPLFISNSQLRNNVDDAAWWKLFVAHNIARETTSVPLQLASMQLLLLMKWSRVFRRGLQLQYSERFCWVDDDDDDGEAVLPG